MERNALIEDGRYAEKVRRAAEIDWVTGPPPGRHLTVVTQPSRFAQGPSSVRLTAAA